MLHRSVSSKCITDLRKKSGKSGTSRTCHSERILFMNITVYLGASEGNDPSFQKITEQLGTWIGSHGHHLIYGGSKIGLMGILADAALRAGGHVTGVEPQMFVDTLPCQAAAARSRRLRTPSLPSSCVISLTRSMQPGASPSSWSTGRASTSRSAGCLPSWSGPAFSTRRQQTASLISLPSVSWISFFRNIFTGKIHAPYQRHPREKRPNELSPDRDIGAASTRGRNARMGFFRIGTLAPAAPMSVYEGDRLSSSSGTR